MKKGFTLIELLAVIVILAIIALIATPIILGIINDAKRESNERSIDMYANAAKQAIARYQLNNTGVPTSFDQLNIEYDGATVDCSTKKINSDGSIYLADCKVGDTLVEGYTYGEQQGNSVAKVCTRQNDEEGFDTVTCTIGENTESFYVMNSYLTDVPSDKIVMMTKYNIDLTTYRQSSTAVPINFSNAYYWSNETTYPVGVYDDRNDVIKPIIENYVSYLNGSLIEDATGSLLTYNQVKNLGCDDSTYSCSSAPSWVYSTSYWTGSANDTNNVWYVDSFGDLGIADSNYAGTFGVRPVITISTSDIK